jgi:hypothetical protein
LAVEALYMGTARIEATLSWWLMKANSGRIKRALFLPLWGQSQSSEIYEVLQL